MKKTVLVTGSSRGIGYATAHLFAQKGWNVAICSRDESEIQSAAERIIRHCEETRRPTEASQKTGSPRDKMAARDDESNIVGFKTDIGDAASTDRLFERVENRFGRLDALVNNAAVIHTGDIFSLCDADFADMMRINVTGLVHCCRHAFKAMKNSGGSIVNISSLAGIGHVDKFPGFWGYTASKFAVTGLTEALAVEGRPYNIRVNGIAPGATDTQMLHKVAPELEATAKPEDIAKLVYHLSDESQSAILSGTMIPVFSNS